MHNNKKKILSIFGTRPEAIKMAPVVHALTQHPNIQSAVCVTAQHRQMLDQVLSLFEITPDHDLNIMQVNQDLYDVTSHILNKMKSVLLQEKPDIVLVQGDTTTCFVAALAAFYQKIPIGHVEAGLRTHHLYAPFPEEANRCLVSRIASFHFPPTEGARENLLRENISDKHIIVTGNTVIDALLWMRNKVNTISDWSHIFGHTITKLINDKESIILITGHRRENFGAGFERVCLALKTLAEKHPNWHFIYPVHLNPNVQKPVNDILRNVTNFHLIAPLDYAPFVYLMDKSTLIITDSGGVQEEAPSLGKPVLVTREVTERPEGVAAGVVILVGTNTQRIIFETESLMQDKDRYIRVSRIRNPYGDGKAAERIVDCLAKTI